ncbi:MAG: flagellar biosynthesis protein FlhA [Actinobacteria bacterium]|nr:flagellar biosynthesis protein FlhA [Actinomycetota bacterium]
MRPNRIGLIGVPAAVIAIVVMLIVPVPTIVLDLLISLNITAAVVVMLMTMHVSRPLDFSVFPPLLLIATLFRLALNISASRLILLHAYAGTVISSFGHFVVGGSIVVGLVVFLILIIIQFVVVTSGAGRVAEVAARFTLDAMPGKQMAIDADLNAGLIGEEEARRRRQEISDKADFYGAMDGASKFVRGDAIAAVTIVAINLLGGFAIGVLQKHMSVSQAVHTYSLLSIGDGLVSQIPALLLSISTGIIVTRTTTEGDFGTDVMHQLFGHMRALRIAGIVMAALAIIPGLPHLAFLVIGVLVFLVGNRAGSVAKRKAEEVAPAPKPAPAPDSPEILAGELRVEPLELEIAPDLVDLVDTARGGDLLDRVRALRRKIAGSKGLIIPPVRTRDNVLLPDHVYVIKVHAIEVARGEAPPGRVLAIGEGIDKLPGEVAREPVFGLPGKWVPAELRQQAAIAGATVVDRASVITTHLSEVVDRNAGRLLSTQQVRNLLDIVKTSDPAVVEEVTSAQLGLGEIEHILSDLLDAQVPIRNLARILSAVATRASMTKDHEALVEAARVAIGPTITAAYAKDGVLPVITLDPALESSLAGSVEHADGQSALSADPALVETMVRQVLDLANGAERQGKRPVLVCAPRLRPALHRLLRAVAPRLGVISVAEMTSQLRPERVGVVTRVDSAVT